jgi:hypothetical protein
MRLGKSFLKTNHIQEHLCPYFPNLTCADVFLILPLITSTAGQWTLGTYAKEAPRVLKGADQDLGVSLTSSQLHINVCNGSIVWWNS